ncbi:MAG: eukaryotic-like serine/threonine-protein kinase [Thermoanaerobaculia bacterium]|jgi:serine/threonine-protein kinase|nr:eukaryotic-like serine/threonine-protein kinase [Thermoanaerobaculia bacterium]
MPTPPPPGHADETLRATDSAPHARLPYAQFAPGSVIAERYRIVSMLGSGGMGEVYRADDLKLGQQVALKFLPAAFARDELQLNLLHDEVRLGRQVAHPNVCRVYDIGEWDGAHFVAMEYVDGEDLARLLHRIGRLSHDKAVDIARGVAAGLSAAHAKGILHRDLKPANIMIDGRGEPRITDFGLALTSEESRDSNVVSGTPAYMAPEQLEGKAASVQSDLYSLGLVMYEIFTGRRARAGRTVPDLRREHTTEVTTPSSVVRDIEPAVERIILRCLDTDPALRPRSARQVFEALPGGDPLAAALAAGETPSPRLVASAGIEGTLTPPAAWAWVGLIAVLLASVLYIAADWRIMSKIAFEKPAEVLEQNAVDIGLALGIPGGKYRVRDFEPQYAYLAWVREHDPSPRRFDHLRTGPPSVVLWLRESPEPLTTYSGYEFASKEDPPLIPGMATIEVDTTGKLFRFAAPPRGTSGAHADWNKVLRLAGFDAAALTKTVPRTVPPFFADERAAWDGFWPSDRNRRAHIEAAAAGGAPVFFSITGPWDEDTGALGRQPFARQSLFLTVLLVVLTLLTIVLAWRNLRLRRGDRTGALRIAIAVFAIECSASLLLADHRAVFVHERSILIAAIRMALLWATSYYFLYIALEPYVRRRWPESLIAWSRLISGKVRDPLIGRDLLIGIAAGLAHANLASLSNWLPARQGWATPITPHVSHLGTLLGVRFALAAIDAAISSGIVTGLALIVLLVVLAMVLRRRSLAALGLYLLQLTAFALAVHGDPYILISGVLITAIWVAVVVRIGLLGIATAQAVFLVSFALPISVDFSAWYLPSAIAPVVAVVLLTAFAFRTAIGSQPMWSGRLLDE